MVLVVALAACSRGAPSARQLPEPTHRFDPVGTFVWEDPRIEIEPACLVKITVRDDRLFGWISEQQQGIERCALREFQLDRIRFDGRRLEFRVVCPGVACPQTALQQRIDVIVDFVTNDLAVGYVLAGNTWMRSGLRRSPIRLVRKRYEFDVPR